MLVPLVITGLIGGLLGSDPVTSTQKTFLRLIPYLLASATLLFVFSGRISKSIRSRSHPCATTRARP